MYITTTFWCIKQISPTQKLWPGDGNLVHVKYSGSISNIKISCYKQLHIYKSSTQIVTASCTDWNIKNFYTTKQKINNIKKTLKQKSTVTNKHFNKSICISIIITVLQVTKKRGLCVDQLGTMNRDEVPGTFPVTKTGLIGTPTAAGITWTDWTSADTGSSGTDVIGPSSVQNCEAEFNEEVVAMVSGAGWYGIWDGTAGHRTSCPTVGDMIEDSCWDDVDDDDGVDAATHCDCAARGNINWPTSAVCCPSTVSMKPPAAVVGINTLGDTWAGDSTSTAAAADVSAHPNNS